MALSNAERQQRHRQRQKEKLRNVEDNIVPTLVELQAYRIETCQTSDSISRRFDYGETPENRPQYALAEYMFRVMMVLGILPSDIENCDPATYEILNTLGGQDYCAAVFEWWENRGNTEPPAIPVT